MEVTSNVNQIKNRKVLKLQRKSGRSNSIRSPSLGCLEIKSGQGRLVRMDLYFSGPCKMIICVTKSNPLLVYFILNGKPFILMSFIQEAWQLRGSTLHPASQWSQCNPSGTCGAARYDLSCDHAGYCRASLQAIWVGHQKGAAHSCKQSISISPDKHKTAIFT